MKITKLNKLILIIIIIAAFLRLYKLAIVPPHLTSDEAALGYNAFSILKTGKDEYGNVLPMIFKSFGDYKPGLYIYLTIPFIALFGLNEYSVRFPSAIAGIISVYLIYLISNQLFPKQNLKIKKYKLTLGHVAALFLAISPWHLQFSRGAWEVNLALTFILAGILYFVRSFKNNVLLSLSAVFFSLSILSYQGAKMSALIVLVLLTAIYFDQIKKYKQSVLAYSVVLGILFILPILFSFYYGKTGRLVVFSVFSYPRSAEFIRSFIREADISKDSFFYYLFYSEPLNFARGILGRLSNHFSGRFLFFVGDWQNMRHTPPYQGVMLLADSVFLPIGLVSIFRSKTISKTKAFIISWLILSPLPAALSRDQVHAVRAFNMVIPLTVITSLGVFYILKKIQSLKSNFHKRLILLACIFTYLFSFIYYLDSYYVHLPNKQASLWFYGYKQTFEKVNKIKDKYDQIGMQQSFSQPYIFYLFYTQYDPSRYQSEAKLSEGDIDVGLVDKVDNIHFRPIQFPDSTVENNVLYVYGPFNTYIDKSMYAGKVKVVDKVTYPNGNLAFIFVEKI